MIMSEHLTRDNSLNFYSLAIGLTRPSTFKGVPLQYAAVCGMVTALGFVFVEDLRLLLIYPLLHAIGYALQVWDHCFIDICFLRFRKGWKIRNVNFWQGNSYHA